MGYEVTLRTIQGISEYNLRDGVEKLVQEVPFGLLPQLVNHKNHYIRWAVSQRLSNKNFSINSYLYFELEGINA